MSSTRGVFDGSSPQDEICVLHVDDDPDFLTVATNFFEQGEGARFEVVTATTAAEGFRAFRDHDVDCIVSDYDMADRNGIEFLEQVRDVDEAIPFILLTGKGSEEIASEAISAGVTDYVQKDPSRSQYDVLSNRITNAVTQYRAERKLERTEERYRRLIEKSRDVIAVIDEDGLIQYISPSVEDLLGYRPTDLAGSSVLDHIHPGDHDDILAAIADLVETPKSRPGVEFRYRLADGSWTWIEARGRNLLDDPIVGGLIITARDVSERKAREAELERSNDLLRHTEEIAETGGWEADVESADVRWTAGTRDIHAVSPTFEPTLERAIQFYHPEDRQTIKRAVEHCAERCEPFDEELRIFTATDQLRWVRARGEPVQNSGGVDRIRGAIQDITAQKERERELETTRERMEYVLEATDSMIWEVDVATDEVVRHGPIEDLFGIDPDRMPTSADFRQRAVHPEDRKTLREKHRAVQAGEETISETTYRTNPDYGDVTWMLEQPHVVIGSEEDPERIIGLTTDVTERKRQEESLRRKNDRLEEFASIVSHDLRNPLNVATGRLDLVRAECDSDHLDAIARSHDRMGALIDDLLTLARQGEAVAEMESVDLDTLCSSCWENTETADATLRVDSAGVIQADPGRVRQLLENLFRNAAEHGGDSVTITVGDLSRTAGFYVEDDGQGIPESDRDRVFEGGYSTLEESTGFGLAIVKRIAEAHGWDLSLVSGDDGGARFEFTGVETGSQ